MAFVGDLCGRWRISEILWGIVSSMILIFRVLSIPGAIKGNAITSSKNDLIELRLMVTGWRFSKLCQWRS